ncbi:nucleoside triphosphate hydrolase [Rhodovulum strictum]|uniref:Nucleoside/nucleotide kinase family protein n=1 Tax=Rhodovulum strictum TaxID=58314 RepID=A0A844BLA3_9RHOB|nr:nucleoside triphosphate hydrolase [Rhodovulum strictum]MRH22425.1 nucleoside/nucleotide kinase family protein [Rhodovulum strictum]
MVETLAAALAACGTGGGRRIVALAGPPGAGKSTLAEAAAARLNADRPGCAVVVPMDGYHLDNAILDALGWRAVKGAPQTFDAAGLIRDLARIRAGGETVFVPVFDRAADLSRAAARAVPQEAGVILVEGNWLLLDEDPWRALAPAFDLSVMLSVPEAALERRLIARWLAHGLDPDAALGRARGNDLANARRVAVNSRPADLVLGMAPDNAR